MPDERKKSGAPPRRRAGGPPGPPRRPSPAPAPPETPAEGVRINRYISQAGVCSRRKADALIAQGRVKLNGVVVAEPGARVHREDAVEVNGVVLSRKPLEYILLNKPEDTITTRSDENGRRIVFDLLDLPDEEKAALYPVGRLDRNTVGALLLTNDGDLAHRLMHPSFGVEKVYRVRVSAPVKMRDLEQLVKGVELEDGPAFADYANYVDADAQNEVLVLLHEGKNRQVRRMMEALNYEVEYLERVSYAGLTTKGIRRGKWRRLTPGEVKRLRKMAKLRG